jgi:hypothetical protein
MMIEDINDAAVLAELSREFDSYERALTENDIPELDRLFHQSPQTVRYGVGEVLYGAEEIAAFRRNRGGSPPRQVVRRHVAVYGEDFGTTHLEFLRLLDGKRGRQTQSWVRFAEGWRVVSAHVSMQGG